MAWGKEFMDRNGYILKRYGLKPARQIEMPIGRDALPELFRDMGLMRGVEVGVERGLYSEQLAKHGLILDAVDPWLAYNGYREHVSQDKLNGFYEETKERLKPYQANVIRATSMGAVKTYPDSSLDFVYIDANHEFQHVTNDIAEWSKKVRVGGVVAGHDFNRNKKKDYICHVKDVVQAWTYSHGIEPWFITNDKSRSWLWIIK